MNSFLRKFINVLFVTSIVTMMCTSLLAQASVGDIIMEEGFEAGGDSLGVPKVLLLEDGSYNYIDWKDIDTHVRIDSLVKLSGKYSATIYHPEDSLFLDCTMLVPIKDMEWRATYEMTVWVKTELTEGAGVLITGWDYAEHKNINGSTDWTQYTVTFEGPMKSESTLNFHIRGKGKIWFDDIQVKKTKEARPNVTINPGFENADISNPAMPEGWFVEIYTGIQELNTDSSSLSWDNTVAHTGNYSANFQQTHIDNNHAWAQAYNRWGTKTYHFTAGGTYEISYWLKTANMHSKSYFCANLGYNNQWLTKVYGDTDWVQVKDTIIFPTDQETNGWRNQIRFILRAWPNEDSLATAWIDDVQFNLLGMMTSAVDSITVDDKQDGSVTITWPHTADITNPTYHILMQPTAEMGRYENNLLENPGFETPNDDGSAPDKWTIEIQKNDEVQTAISEYPADESYDGNYAVWIGEEDTQNEKGIKAVWKQTFDGKQMRTYQTYLYGAMVKHTDVKTTNGKVFFENSPFDSIYTGGVHIWYDRDVFHFQNEQLLEIGCQTPVGTSNGFTEVAIPITYGQGEPRHNFGIGLGWSASAGYAKGNAYIDNAFVSPFVEVATTSDNTITLTDVPENVKYFSIYVSDGDGKKLKSFGQLGVKKSIIITDVEKIDDTPATYSLEQNYPNPFNPTTTIKYTLPETGKVNIEIYDILGRRVAVLIDKEQTAGTYKISFDASKYASGVYFYKLQSNSFVKTKKMMLIK